MKIASKLKFRFFAFTAIVLGLMIVDYHSSYLHSLRSMLYSGTKPLVNVAEIPTDIAYWVQLVLQDRKLLNERNQEVEAENARLRRKVIELEDKALHGQWISELLNSKEKLNEEVLLAKLNSIDLNPLTHKIVVNRGNNEDVFIGQPVVDYRGVIGQVTDTTSHNSAVTLLTDPNHSIPVRIRRNGLLAVANGLGGSHMLSVPNIPQNQDIQVGDVLITSGLGRRFPSGYPVATITSVTRDKNAPFLEVKATPLAKIDRGYDVLLVWYGEGYNSEINTEYSMNDTGAQR